MRGLIASLSLLLTVGCTPIVREVRHPGGYPGYMLDKRTFDASRSKHLQLFRATMIMTMAARMGTATIRDGRDADAFADYLASASDEINYAGADLFAIGNVEPCTLSDSSVPAGPCKRYYAIFESDMPMLEARITRLMLAALPEDRARAFLQDIAKGNVMSAAWNAWKVIYETTGGLHRATGVYRSGLEVIAANMPCASSDDDQRQMTVWDAADCLGLTHDQLFDNPEEKKGDSLPRALKRDAFHALMLIARTSCARLPITTDGGTGVSIPDQLSARDRQCKRVEFNPKVRPGS